MNVRFCDRIGMGRPKESPYRLRKYDTMIDEAMRAPLSVTSLKIDGNRLMELLKIQPLPKIYQILNILLKKFWTSRGKIRKNIWNKELLN